MLATRFPECCTLLLGARASVEARDAHGFTPLHWAAHDEGSLSPTCIEQLHAAGADVDATDDGGFTPLHHAAELGTLKSLEALLEAGASVDAADAGSRSALHEVVVRESTSAFDAAAAAQRLLARGADVNARDDDGVTPLHRAAQAGRVEVVAVLLANGADESAVTHDDASVPSLARARRDATGDGETYERTVALLKAAFAKNKGGTIPWMYHRLFVSNVVHGG